MKSEKSSIRVSMGAYEEDVSPLDGSNTPRDDRTKDVSTTKRTISCRREDLRGPDEMVDGMKRKRPYRPTWRKVLVAVLVGSILLASGLICGFYFHYTIESQIEEQMRVCDKSASSYDGWLQNFEGSPNETAIEEDKETTIPLYNYFYVYNMTNPTEYLQGMPPLLVEKGPYVLREYISFLNVSFEVNGNVTYDQWHYYVPQDGDAPNTKDMNCAGCHRNDVFTNLNVAYLKLLAQGQNEGSVILGSKCTPNQIVNIASAIAGQMEFCNSTQAGDVSADDQCGCCNPYPSKIPERRDGELTCTSITDLKGSTVGLFSLLAYYDGGSLVTTEKSAFTASGLYSPLTISKSVKEFALGYPNALAGYMFAKLSLTTASKLYPGNVPALQQALASQSAYTSQVGDMCAPLCTAVTNMIQLGFLIMEGRMEDVVNCDARLPSSIENMTYRYLDGISCKPYAFTMLTTLVCNPQLGGKNCMCADGSDPLVDGPCCLATGENTIFNLNLGGMGCLYEVPGIINDRQFASAAQREAFYKEQGKTKRSGQITGCGEKENGEQHVGWVSLSDSETQSDLWQYDQPSIPPTGLNYDAIPPSPGRVTAFANGSYSRATKLGGQTYTSTTRGSLGQRFPGTSVNTNLFSWDLSTGTPYNDTYQIFLKQARRPVQINFNRATSIKGVTTDLFTTEPKFLDRDFEDNAITGAGVPMDGVDCLSYVYGAHIFVHRPNFLYGDERLLSQIDVPARFEYAANRSTGIRLYRGFDSYEPSANPLPSPQRITNDTLSEFANSYDTLMYIEPASGLTVQANGRIGASFAVFACDPKDPLSASCALFPNNDAKCYVSTSKASPFLNDTSLPCSAANVLTPNVLGDVIVPQYWVDQNSAVNDYVAGKLRDAGKLHFLSGVLLVIISAIGGLLILLGAWWAYRDTRNSENDEDGGEAYYDYRALAEEGKDEEDIPRVQAVAMRESYDVKKRSVRGQSTIPL